MLVLVEEYVLCASPVSIPPAYRLTMLFLCPYAALLSPKKPYLITEIVNIKVWPHHS